MLPKADFVLLDAARMGSRIGEAKARNRVCFSLYRGHSETDLADVAPYIFQFTKGAPFANWFLKKGWGDAWGILLKSSWPMTELHKHFRKFLRVKTEDGASLYFRFYDPRVLRIFLPTCDDNQIREFFGDRAIEYFFIEDVDPAFGVCLRHENGILKTDRIPVAEIIAGIEEPELVEQSQTPEELPPETLAVIADLRRKYPDLELPGLVSSDDDSLGKERNNRISSSAFRPESPRPQINLERPKTKWDLFEET